MSTGIYRQANSNNLSLVCLTVAPLKRYAWNSQGNRTRFSTHHSIWSLPCFSNMWSRLLCFRNPITSSSLSFSISHGGSNEWFILSMWFVFIIVHTDTKIPQAFLKLFNMFLKLWSKNPEWQVKLLEGLYILSWIIGAWCRWLSKLMCIWSIT